MGCPSTNGAIGEKPLVDPHQVPQEFALSLEAFDLGQLFRQPRPSTLVVTNGRFGPRGKPRWFVSMQPALN